MITAYDYEKQAWVTGEPARLLRIAQLTTDLLLLKGPEGERFARFSGIRDMNETIARMSQDLLMLSGAEEMHGGTLAEWH